MSIKQNLKACSMWKMYGLLVGDLLTGKENYNHANKTISFSDSHQSKIVFQKQMAKYSAPLVTKKSNRWGSLGGGEWRGRGGNTQHAHSLHATPSLNSILKWTGSGLSSTYCRFKKNAIAHLFCPIENYQFALQISDECTNECVLIATRTSIRDKANLSYSPSL